MIDEYSTKKTQEKLLQMIKDIDTICTEHGISYSLCGGSLLGAVRHKGFIPWDDDMDITFTRDEYNRFRAAFNNNNYKIVQDIWVPRIVTNILSDTPACIDIFIFDNVPDNEFLSKLKVFIIKILQGMMKKTDLSNPKYSILDKTLIILTGLAGKLFSLKTKQKMYSVVSQFGNKKKTLYINAYNDLYKLLNLKYPSRIINSFQFTDFENTKLSIMCGYDEYLTLQYGDYMTPPPLNERKPQHIKS